MDDADSGADNRADNEADGPEMVARVRAALSSLPPAHRDVIELTHLRGMTSHQAAAQLDLPVAQVDRLRDEALEHIQDELYPPSDP